MLTLPFRPDRRIQFFILAALYFMVYLQRQAPAVLALDFMRDLDLDSSALGWLTAAFFYPYALMQIPAGWISRALGPGLTLGIFFALASTATWAFAYIQGLPPALVLRILIGIGIGMVLVPMLDIVAAQFAKDRFGFLVGILMAVGGLGAFAGGGPLAQLDAALGWRGAMALLGVLSLGLALAIWLISGTSVTPAERRSAPRNSFQWRAFGRLLLARTFWPSALWAFFALGIFMSFGGLWAGPFLMHVLDIPKIEAGHILSMQALGMIIGSPCLTWVVNRWPSVHAPRRVLIGAGLVLCALAAWLFSAPAVWPPWSLYLWFLALGGSSMAATPIALIIVRQNAGPAMAGPATGIFNFFCLLGGALLQPIGGWLLETAGATPSLDYEAIHCGPLFGLYLLMAAGALASALCVKASKDRI